MIDNTYNEHFKALLASLNATQFEAVTNIEGPVIAIAGPGTGKTHILTARIGQILLETDTQAHNILCLTFTDAAVNAMRQRLLEFIGPDAHRVHIYTFHSFCNKVIQENIEIFGRHELEPLNDLERIDIIRNIIHNLDIEHILRSNTYDPYYYERHLAELFKLMKGERWTAAFVQAKIQEYLQDLPNNPDLRYKRKSGKFKVGDLKEAKYQDILKKMLQLEEGSKLFDLYVLELEKRQRYDYDDMILWVLNAFEKEEFLLRFYQEQYLYLLVDEFQDTNGSQSTVVQSLVAYWGDNPNLFIVGDDDQSIYEFQGARVKNLADIYEKYKKNLLLILLTENYRSSQHILDAAKKSIDHNEIRIINKISALSLDKNLIAANPLYAALETPVQVVAYPSQLQEEIAIIQQIETLQKQGVALKEIAIIYAKHRQASGLIQLLEKRKIPYQSKRKLNILELPLVYNLRKLMSYIVNEFAKPYSNEDVFFEFLHYDFIGIPPSDVAKLMSWVSINNQKNYEEKKYSAIIKWRDLIRDTALLESLGLQDSQRLLDFGVFLDQCLYNYKNWSLPKLVEFIINRSGLIAFITNHEQKSWLTQVVLTIFDFVKQETTKNNKLNLKALLNLLDQMDSNRIGLGLFQIHYAEDGVNLVTAHSAKGLEFEYVFIINALKDFWEPGGSGGKHFSFPDTISYSNESDAMEAARRLFYVAMTRAKKVLQISYYQVDTKNKISTKACFLDELVQSNEPFIQFSEKQAVLTGEWELLTISEIASKTPVLLLEKAVLDTLLEDFKLSVSAMNSFLYCPLGFYYEYVLRIQSLSSPEAAYGTAIHNALNRIFNFAVRKNKNKLPDLQVFLDYFVAEMKKHRYFLPVQTYTEYLELGNRHIPLYYAARKDTWNKLLQEASVLTEKSLKNVEWEGIPITGTLDKLLYLPDVTGHKAHIVDYKTGLLKEDRLQAPTKSNPEGGNYWRQLIFYKILFDNSNISPHIARSAEIDYITPDAKGVFPSKTITFVAEEVEQVKVIIKDVYQKIKGQEFSEGCGKPTCKWCNFAKRNIVSDSFVNEEIEMLDD